MNKDDISLDSQKVNGTINAFITNLGKYNEGELVGKWHSFPTTSEEIAQAFKEIGIDGDRYEEFFLTDYESEVSGVHDALSEYANLDEINYLASKLEDMTNREVELFEAAVDSGEYSGSLEDLINLTENLDCYDYAEGILDDSDLGYYYVEDSGIYDLESMGSLANYIDYEKFGRDIRIDEGGTFAGNGYIRNNGDSFHEIYNGVAIPDEYRVFPLSDELDTEHEHGDKGMTVLLVEPEKEPRMVEIDGSLVSMQSLVGGLIQVVYPYEDLVALVCNDEGKMEGLPLNRALHDADGKMCDIVAGNFFVCGLDSEDGGFASLSPELAEKFTEQFKHGEQFMKLAGQIVAVKMPLEKQKDGLLDKSEDSPNKSNEPEL